MSQILVWQQTFQYWEFGFENLESRFINVQEIMYQIMLSRVLKATSILVWCLTLFTLVPHDLKTS